jgi:hypothetical protein
MLQVINVIHEKPGQGNFSPAPDLASGPLAFLGQALGDVDQVGVVSPPQINQVVPKSASSTPLASFTTASSLSNSSSFLFGTDSGNKIIGECLKTPGVTSSNSGPIPPHIRFTEKVGHVLLPLFPVFGVQ